MKRGAIVGIVIAAVLLAGAGLAWWFLSRPPGPEATARAYLEALAAGDGAAALSIAAPPPGGGVAQEPAFAGAEAYLTDPDVVRMGAVENGRTTASVSFSLDGDAHEASIGLVELDGRWTVAADGFGLLSATTTLGAGVSVGGIPVPSGEEVALLPTVYAVAATPAVLLDGATTIAILPGQRTDAEVTASVTPEATTLAQEQLDAYAQACTQPAAAVPANCGIRVPWAADLASLDEIVFRIERMPQVVLSPDLRSFAATAGVLVATATGETRDGTTASFTYRADDWALRGAVELSDDGMELSVG